MSCSGKYLYFLLFLVTIKRGHSYDINTNKTIRALNNILNMNSWQTDNEYIIDNMSKEQIFEHGELKTLSEIVGYPLKIEPSNLNEKSGAMYLAFQCKCSKMIKTIIGLLNVQAEKNDKTDLIDINKLVLKTTSALFNFVQLFTNVRYHNNSLFLTLLSINVHLNNLIENRNPQANDSSKNINMNFQLINLIERFIISNCSIQGINEDVSSNISSTGESHNTKEKIQSLIIYFDKLINNTGLETFDYLAYNINNNVSKAVTSNDQKLNSNIILQVLIELNPILHFIGEFNYSSFPKTVDDIFKVQRSVYAVIMRTIYHLTQQILSVGNVYPTKNNIKEKKYLQVYRWFYIQSKVMQFPKNFIEHMEFMLKMIEDVISFGEVKNISFLRYVIKQKLESIDERLFMQTENSKLLNNNLLNDFILKLLSIKNIKYFNDIFQLLCIEFDESYSKVVKHTQALNRVQYLEIMTETDMNDKLCSAVEKLYPYCFDMESTAGGEQSSLNSTKGFSGEDHKKHLSIVSKFLNELEETDGTSFILNGNHDTKSLILYAIQYARFNVENYPTAGNVQEKVKRTVNHIMNLFDKYQMYNCAKPKYRYSQYKIYTANSNETDRFQTIKVNDTNTAAKKIEKRFTLSKSIRDVQSKVLLRQATKVNENVQTIPSEMTTLKTIIENLSAYQPYLRFTWKGELCLVTTAMEDIAQNSFNLQAHLMYTNTIFEWAFLVLFYTTIDVLNFAVSENRTPEILPETYKKLQLDKVIRNYGYCIIKTVANMNSTNINNSLDLIGLEIILEDYVDSIDEDVSGNILPSGKMADYTQRISTIVEHLNDFFNTFQ